MVVTLNARNINREINEIKEDRTKICSCP